MRFGNLAGLLVGTIVLGSGVLGAQCIANDSPGSKINPNRPSDADTPAPAFSPLAAFNGLLPAWICFNAGYRTRIEGYSGANFLPNASASYLLTRFRFGMAIKPASWLKIYMETQDADAFLKTPPLSPPYQETWDLRTAYLDLGDFQDGHLGLRVGRQDLNFEDSRLVGTSYWRNASRGYDGAQVASNWSEVSATAFAASPVEIQDNGLSGYQPGNDLYGIDARFNKLIANGTVDPFLFWRVTPELNEKTLGARFAGTTPNGWDYDTEGARQAGILSGSRIRAWAWLGIAGYTFSNLRFKTRLFSEYDFASGDRNPNDAVHGTFDQLFPNIHDHLGMADLFAWQNLKAVRAGVRIWLRPNWIVASIWNCYWLASTTDGFYNSSGVIVARDPSGRSGTHIGEEYNAQTSYRFDRNLEFGLGVAHVVPGEFLIRTGHPIPYNYPYAVMNYNFF